MLMSEYASMAFIGLDTVRKKPFRGKIKNVQLGNYGRPVIEFEGGQRFSLAKKNTRILIEAFGDDSRNWPGREIELYFGQTDIDGEPKDTVKVRVISSDKKAEAAPKPEKADKLQRPAAGDDMDQEIPF